MTPKSGQVATTTSTPAARSLRTAAPSSAAARDGMTLAVMSLAPITITAMSGWCSSALVTWSSSPVDSAPTAPTVSRRTGSPVSAASPRASSTPGRSAGREVP